MDDLANDDLGFLFDALGIPTVRCHRFLWFRSGGLPGGHATQIGTKNPGGMTAKATHPNSHIVPYG